MKTPASAALVIQSFRPLSTQRIAALFGARGEGERIRSGTGLGERIRADGIGGEHRQILRLLIVGAPAHERVVDERVLDVDEHAARSIDVRELFDDEHGVEERRSGAAPLFRDFDAHDAELEEALDQVLRHRGVVIHLRDEGANLLDREIANALLEHLLFFRQHGQGCAGSELEGGGHQRPPEGSVKTANHIRSNPVIIPRRTASPGGGTGRRSGLKIPCPYGRAGSIPARGTIAARVVRLSVVSCPRRRA